MKSLKSCILTSMQHRIRAWDQPQASLPFTLLFLCRSDNICSIRFFLCFTWFLDPLLRPAANPHKKNMKILFLKKSTKKIHKVNKVRTLLIHLYFNYDLWLFSFFYFVYWHKYFSSRQLPSNESQQTTSCWQLSEFGTIICYFLFPIDND